MTTSALEEKAFRVSRDVVRARWQSHQTGIFSSWQRWLFFQDADLAKVASHEVRGEISPSPPPSPLLGHMSVLGFRGIFESPQRPDLCTPPPTPLLEVAMQHLRKEKGT